MTTLYEVITHVLERAGPMESLIVTRSELLDAIEDNFTVTNDAIGHPVKRSVMAAQIRALESALETERSMRPQWAQGFTDESIAAQTTSTAMHQLWKLLGANNQTEAVMRVKELLNKDFDKL